MNAKNYPQVLNYYRLGLSSQPQRQLAENCIPPQSQLNHLNHLPANNFPNNFNLGTNPNNYYGNNFSSNDRPFLIFTQMPNPSPASDYNKIIFMQNPPNNNRIFMPVIQTENIGYVLMRNPNQNLNNLNLMQAQNFRQPSNSNNNNFYSSFESDSQNMYYRY